MTRLYLIGLICTIIIGAYFYGMHVGNSKCKIQNFQNEIILMKENSNQERIINDKVYKTGVGDIRRILHDKYSIAE
ncbi:MAG: hypothetical protein IKZ49_00170 [Alphaproteobacteria bacterium]|nr:hypothetical protein [Alphaproteobacteria bacterium]